MAAVQVLAKPLSEQTAHPARGAAWAFLSLLLAAAAVHAADVKPAAGPAAIAPDEARPFLPGVRIDWRAGAVHVDAVVVLRTGQLEFLASFHSKDHESILRCQAAANSIYLALGLAGLTPGHPPRWNQARQEYDAPEGAALDLFVRWRADGQIRTTNAFDWLTELEFGTPPVARPWIFGGSTRLDEHHLAADRSGVGIATVDFPDALISYSRRFPSVLGGVWVAARTEAIPPLGTPVTLIIRPAAVPKLDVRMDYRGLLSAAGRYLSAEDLLDIVGVARTIDPEFAVRISVERTLRADQSRLLQLAAAAGLPPETIRFTPFPDNPD